MIASLIAALSFIEIRCLVMIWWAFLFKLNKSFVDSASVPKLGLNVFSKSLSEMIHHNLLLLITNK
jgi:hypothetical protein